MTRRTFALLPAAAAQAATAHSTRRLTSGPKHHFFGYYGISPWNRSGSTIVCLESSFRDRLPKPGEAAAIVTVDPASGAATEVTTTRAWNLQQGAMLHWNPLKPETEFLFNERDEEAIISAAYDLATGRRRTMPRAINGVSSTGRYALCLTYGRLTRLRPVVGYPGAVDPFPNEPHPQNDGVFVMDLSTGKAPLVVSIREVFERLVTRHPELRERHMWFNHTVFNPSGTRFFFLARCWEPDGKGGQRLQSAMFTCGANGESLREVLPFGRNVSHFEWRNDREILVTCRWRQSGVQHVLFTDGESDHRPIGEEFLSGDGHCSFAPGGEWMVTDRNDAARVSKHLMIYNLRTRQGVNLGEFPMLEQRYLGGDTRCDLHPRWKRSGDEILVDAIDTGSRTRQLFAIQLSGLK
jgi:hypothetical protein